MSKKPRKIEDAANYTTKKSVKAAVPAQTGLGFADLEKVRASNAKLVQVHRKGLRKLAR